MRVYRIASARYAPDNSEGARLVGGRWNEPGIPVIYAAASISLAALEVLVHHGLLPADYRVISITIPDSVHVEGIDVDLLDEDWFEESGQQWTAAFGSAWVVAMRGAVLAVPSAVIRTEMNYILNPLHPDFEEIVFEIPDVDDIDPRLRKLPKLGH